MAGLIFVGLIVLLVVVLRLSKESPSTYAQRQVQALFVDVNGTPVGAVTGCHTVAPGEEPGTTIWACSVKGSSCSRTLRFSVSREYGTAPYDSAAADATGTPCRARRRP